MAIPTTNRIRATRRRATDFARLADTTQSSVGGQITQNRPARCTGRIRPNIAPRAEFGNNMRCKKLTNYYQTRYVYILSLLCGWSYAIFPAVDDIKATIRTLTTRTGLSQADVARLLGVPAKTLNAWLSGRVTCRHKTMLTLALEALGGRLSLTR